MKRWFVPFSVGVFALLGYGMTFAYHGVPALRSSHVMSLLVPFDVIVEPVFDTHPVDIEKEVARTVAPLNAGLYAVVGFVVAAGIKHFRKAVTPPPPDGSLESER